jgi:Ca-activated chloride channel family protein
MSRFTFEEPLLGLAALAACVCVAVVLRRRGALATARGERSAPSAAAALLGARAPFVERLPLASAALGLVCLCLALARPVERVAEALTRRGRDVVLVLDVSSSMGERDLDRERTRLAVARDAAAEFVAARPADRFALVTFARFPDLVVPLTHDHVAMNAALAALELVEPDGDEDVTGIGLALARATRAASGDGRRVVVLLTDGLENVANGRAGEITPVDAARLAKSAGVRVHTIAAGARLADAASDAASAPAGGAASSDELAAIARHTGGTAARVGDAQELALVWDTIDRFEAVEWNTPVVRTFERFHLLVAAGVALLVLARGLNEGPCEVLP